MQRVFVTCVAAIHIQKDVADVFDAYCQKWQKMDKRLKKETQDKIRIVQNSILKFATDEYIGKGENNFTLPIDIAKSIVDGTYYV